MANILRILFAVAASQSRTFFSLFRMLLKFWKIRKSTGKEIPNLMANNRSRKKYLKGLCRLDNKIIHNLAMI